MLAESRVDVLRLEPLRCILAAGTHTNIAIGARESALKIATYKVGGERRVGLVNERNQTLAAFDIPESEAALGILALLDRPTPPRTLPAMPMREAVLEAPIPRPRRNI